MKKIFIFLILIGLFVASCSRTTESSVEDIGNSVVLHENLNSVISTKTLFLDQPMVFYETDTVKMVKYDDNKWVENNILFYGNQISTSGQWDVVSCMDGSLWIFFESLSDYRLYAGKYGKNKWSFRQLSSEKFSKNGVSLSADCYDYPAVSVMDPFDGSIKYFYSEANTWTKEDIVNDGEVGKFLDMKKGFGDEVFVAFNNGSTGNIDFAIRKGKGDWSIELTGVQGDRLSLNVGNVESGDISTIYPRIAVRSSDNRKILYLNKKTSSWVKEEKDVDSYIGNIKLLSDGEKDYIVYDDSGWQDVKVMYKSGDEWFLSPVITKGSIGYAMSSAINNRYIIGATFSMSENKLYFFKTTTP